MLEKEAKTQALVEAAYSMLVDYHERATSGVMDEQSAQPVCACSAMLVVRPWRYTILEAAGGVIGKLYPTT